MRHFRIAFIFGLALMILAGCSKEEIQPDPQNASDEVALSGDDSALKGAVAANDDNYIPLHGTFHVHVEEELGDIKTPPKILRSLGEGNLIHLGKTEVILMQAWVPLKGKPGIPPWSGQGWSYKGSLSQDYHIKFITNDGEIWAEYGSPTKPFSPYLYGNAFSFHKTEYHVEVSFIGIIITDNCTGIYKGATGKFSWNVIYNPNTNKGVAKIRGQIIL